MKAILLLFLIVISTNLFSAETIYYIITKVEVVDDAVVRTNIGYVTTEEKADSINTLHCADFDAWRATNLDGLNAATVDVTDYFDVDTIVYEVAIHTKDLGSLGIPLITDLENVE